MSFGENLQTLRKAKGISQEQLAERLDVSRQAVSKWESGGGYPETDKIIALCEFFGCSMDELMLGKISVSKPDDRKAYDNMMNRFARGISLGVGLILFGVALCVLSSVFYSDVLASLGAVVLLMFVAVAVAIFIICGLEHENFKRVHPKMPEIYSDDEINGFNTRVFPRAIAVGVLLIFISVIQIILVSAINDSKFPPENQSLAWISIQAPIISAAIMLALIGVAVMIFVYYGIQHDKYDIKKYNNEIRETERASRSRRNQLMSAINGTIMLTATTLFLISGFVFEIWHPAWIVFPIGGLLCGIVDMFLNIGSKEEITRSESKSDFDDEE